MAGRTTAFWKKLAALALCVALAHWLAMAWLAQGLQTASVLRPMATPLFTRALAPADPAPRARAARTPAARPQAPAPTPPPAPDAPVEPAPSEALAPSTTPEPRDQAASAPAPAGAVPPGAAGVEGAGWPGNTRLRYLVGGNYRGALHGNARVQWQREGERYQVQLDVSLGWLAQFTMTSQGRVTTDHLMPEAFEEEIAAARRNVRFTTQELQFMNGARQARPDGVQDTASQFVELTHRFANAAEPLAVGQSVTFWMARPGGADEWTYDVVELDTLSTPRHGALQAFHLKPRPLARPRGPITAELWFAPTLQYLPVRIRINLGEQIWIDLMVDTIEQSEVAPAP